MSRRARLYALSLVGALASLPSLAAPRVTVVYVGLDPAARVAAGAFEAATERAAVGAGRFQWVPPADATSPSMAKLRQAKLEEAQAALAKGQAALDALDNALADVAFNEALDAGAELDSSRGFAVVLDALSRKAGNHATAGELAASKHTLERLFALDAKAELNPALFPPEILKYSEALRRTMANAKGTLIVRSEPAGANVWVDGQPRGQAPMTLEGLASGQHAVVVALGGRAPEHLELEAGETLVSLKPAELGAAYTKPLELLSKDPVSKNRDVVLRGLAKTLKVEQVVGIFVKKSIKPGSYDVTALRLDGKDGHNLSYAQEVVESNRVGPFMQLLFMRDDLRRGGPVGHFDGASSGVDGKLVAGLALLGTAAAATAVGTVMGVQAGNKHRQFLMTPQASRESALYQTDGRTFALVADVTLIGAAVTAVAGGVLTVLGATSNSAPPPEPTKPQNRRSAAKAVQPKVDETARKRQEAADRARLEEERQKAEDERRKEEERRADEERLKAREEADAERAAVLKNKKLTPAERKKEEERRKAEDARRKLEDEEAERRRLEDERKRRDDARQRQEEADRKKMDEDLRNH